MQRVRYSMAARLRPFHLVAVGLVDGDDIGKLEKAALDAL